MGPVVTIIAPNNTIILLLTTQTQYPRVVTTTFTIPTSGSPPTGTFVLVFALELLSREFKKEPPVLR